MGCCPHLVYGTRDETGDILSASENLWEGVTEGWRSLDSREADFSLRDNESETKITQNAIKTRKHVKENCVLTINYLT